MSAYCSTSQHADRRRDSRKTTADYIGPINAYTVTLLARAYTTDFDEAQALIDNYAQIVATQAVADALKQTITSATAASITETA